MPSSNNYRRIAFKRCKHTTLGTCDEGTDSCCATVACDLCLKIVDDDDDILTSGTAAFSESEYSGSVGGHTFRAYWSRDQYTDECQFTVIINEDEYDEQILTYDKCGYDGVTCTSPSGETTVTYGGNDRTLTWTVMDALELPHVEVNINPCEALDVAFVLDITGSMGAVLADLKTNISDIVSTITGIADNYQLALHTFRDEVFHDVEFSVNNQSTFITALNALSASGGAGVPEASDYALAESVAQTGWRLSETTRKIVILITDAPPGGLDDVDDPEDAERLYQAARDAKANDQFLLAVRSGTSTLTGSVLSQAATNAEGLYLSTADYLSAEIQSLIEGLCPQGLCKVPFCGTCKCSAKKLCVRITGDECEYSVIVDPEEDYCGPIPEWNFDLTCGDFSYSGSVALQRDEYDGGCNLILSGSAYGGDEETQTQTVSDCRNLSASFTVTDGDGYDADEYVIAISPADCDTCDPPPIPTPCCPDGIPRILTATITGSAACPEAIGVAFTLVYSDPVLPATGIGTWLWNGSMAKNPYITRMELSCVSVTPTSSNWLLDSDICSHGFHTYAETPYPCDPVELVFSDTGMLLSCCDTPELTGVYDFTITVTE